MTATRPPASSSGSGTPGTINVLDHGAVGSGLEADAEADTAAFEAAVALGGTVVGRASGNVLDATWFTLKRPIILNVDRTSIADNHMHTRPSTSFPHQTLSGSKTLPSAGTVFTLTTAETMRATWPSSGVGTILTTTGIAKFTYTSITGNTFNGCKSHQTGSILANAVIGTYRFWLGDPVGGSGVFETYIGDGLHYGTTDSTDAGLIPGISIVYTNRAQEGSGLRGAPTLNGFARHGFTVELFHGDGIPAQNWLVEDVNCLFSGSCDASAAAIDIDCGYTPCRGVMHSTVTNNTNSQSPAGTIGMRLRRVWGGEFHCQQPELHTTAVQIDNAYAPGECVQVTVKNVNARAGMVNALQITAGGDKPYSAYAIDVLDPATILIDDQEMGDQATDLRTAFYYVLPKVLGVRKRLTDSQTVSQDLSIAGGSGTMPSATDLPNNYVPITFGGEYLMVPRTQPNSAIAYVGDLGYATGNEYSGVATMTFVTIRDVDAGNTAIIRAGNYFGAGAIPVSVSGGGLTWRAQKTASNGGGSTIGIFTGYATARMPMGTTITVTFADDSDSKALFADVWTGLADQAADQNNSASGTSTAPSPGAITTTEQALCIAAHSSRQYQTDTQWQPAAGWVRIPAWRATNDSEPFTIMSQARLETSTGTFTGSATLTASHEWVSAVVSLKHT